MEKHFTVEIRTDCRVCGAPLPPRYRSYCSKQCRQKETNKRYYPSQREWTRRKYAKYAFGKLKCGICGGWYVQVGTHVRQRHGMTAREYREYMDLPVKRGISPQWFREMKAQQAVDNGTIENLKTGKKHWYKKNDPKAKLKKVGWKGRAGSTGYSPTDLYE